VSREGGIIYEVNGLRWKTVCQFRFRRSDNMVLDHYFDAIKKTKQKSLRHGVSSSPAGAHYTRTMQVYADRYIMSRAFRPVVFIVLIKPRTKLDVARPVRKRPVYTWASFETQRRYIGIPDRRRQRRCTYALIIHTRAHDFWCVA